MKGLKQYITEKLIVNKDYNYISPVEDIRNATWKNTTYGKTSDDIKLWGSFFDYIRGNLVKEVSSFKMRRDINKGDYFCVINETETIIYLYNKAELTWSNTIPTYNKICIGVNEDTNDIYFLSVKHCDKSMVPPLNSRNHFSSLDDSHYYIIDKEFFEEIQNLFDEL